MIRVVCFSLFFFFNDTATTEIYTLSLHDALPISPPHDARYATAQLSNRCGTNRLVLHVIGVASSRMPMPHAYPFTIQDRKSTRLNSSHANISYAVFCLKKKKKTYITTQYNHNNTE